MDSKDKILELLNRTNEPFKLITKKNVDMFNVVAVDIEGPTTRITLDSVPGRGFTGSVEVEYRRLDLGQIADGITVRSLNPMTPKIVVDLVNSALGLFLTVDDLGPFATPNPTEGEVTQVMIEALPEAPGFIGSATINIEYGRTWLDHVVANRSLPELRHPISLVGWRCARMMTWNKDFTSLRDAIKPTVRGYYTDWPRLQQACIAMGLPTWSQDRIVDLAVKDVPSANQAFDRVVIQSTMWNGSMLGQIYLHYNVLEEV